VRCPFCISDETRVVDSRLVGDGAQVRRRRECSQCRERFTTYESAELTLPRVVKQDGRRTPFNRDKLRAGLLRALEKRPVPVDRIEAMLGRIERLLIATGEREVRSREIGERVMDELKEIDQVAYVRFASVYRSFEDVKEFRDAVERLEREPTPELRRDQISLLPKDE
jgi:transcriptional repressor NrdR